MSPEDDIAAILNHAAATFGGLDTLVNKTGVLHLTKYISTATRGFSVGAIRAVAARKVVHLTGTALPVDGGLLATYQAGDRSPPALFAAQAAAEAEPAAEGELA